MSHHIKHVQFGTSSAVTMRDLGSSLGCDVIKYGRILEGHFDDAVSNSDYIASKEWRYNSMHSLMGVRHQIHASTALLTRKQPSIRNVEEGGWSS
jgi:hypothetical protein